MGKEAEGKAGPSRSQRWKRAHGMRHDSGEECACLIGAEPPVPEGGPLIQCCEPETKRRFRFFREAEEGVQGEGEDSLLALRQGLHQPAVCRPVDPESLDRAVKAAVGDSGAPGIERMRIGDVRYREPDPLADSERPEEGRCQCHGMYCGAEVMEVLVLHEFECA